MLVVDVAVDVDVAVAVAIAKRSILEMPPPSALS